MSVILIGLAYGSTLLAASKFDANRDKIGGKAPVSRQLQGQALGALAKFRRAQEVLPPLAELQRESPAPEAPQQGRGAAPPGPAFSTSAGPVIAGRVLYRGPVPAPTQFEVNRDQDVCGTTMSMVALSVDTATDGLQNAVVHVELGEGETSEAGFKAAPVVVRNAQCRFHPHVSAAQVGNEMGTVNDDPLLHNIHITVANSTVLNVAMVAGGSPIKKRLKKAGLQQMNCNVHMFMRAYRLVFDDSYFDQTTETGQFSIAGVSPGSHRITVWHETLGLLEKDVQVPAQGTVAVDLEYK
jgi:plastocyanin